MDWGLELIFCHIGYSDALLSAVPVLICSYGRTAREACKDAMSKETRMQNNGYAGPNDQVGIGPGTGQLL